MAATAWVAVSTSIITRIAATEMTVSPVKPASTAASPARDSSRPVRVSADSRETKTGRRRRAPGGSVAAAG